MKNKFYNPHLAAMMLLYETGEKMEEEAQSIDASDPTPMDIVNSVKYFNAACNKIDSVVFNLLIRKKEIEFQEKEFMAIPEIHEILLDYLSLEDLKLLSGSLHVLRKRCGVNSVRQLCELSAPDIYGLLTNSDYLKKRIIKEVRNKLSYYGLYLRDEAPESNSKDDEDSETGKDHKSAVSKMNDLIEIIYPTIP